MRDQPVRRQAERMQYEVDRFVPRIGDAVAVSKRRALQARMYPVEQRANRRQRAGSAPRARQTMSRLSLMLLKSSPLPRVERMPDF